VARVQQHTTFRLFSESPVHSFSVWSIHEIACLISRTVRLVGCGPRDRLPGDRRISVSLTAAPRNRLCEYLASSISWSGDTSCEYFLRSFRSGSLSVDRLRAVARISAHSAAQSWVLSP